MELPPDNYFFKATSAIVGPDDDVVIPVAKDRLGSGAGLRDW